MNKLDVLYNYLFGYKTDGYFVDVGAYDGVAYSNTFGLANAGWGGLCFEPVPEYYKKCALNHKEHPKVKCFQTCIGNREDVVDFYVSDVYSTHNANMIYSNLRNALYTNSEVIESKITTLDRVLEANKTKPGFEVLSIDVEGSEVDVLNGFNIDHWKPQMCIIEAHERNIHPEMRINAPFINSYFQKAMYRRIYCDDTNNIYVLSELIESWR